MQDPTVVGVDISKTHLDAYRTTDGKAARFTNDAAGFKALAVMRKLLVLANALLEQDRTWSPERQARPGRHPPETRRSSPYELPGGPGLDAQRAPVGSHLDSAQASAPSNRCS